LRQRVPNSERNERTSDLEDQQVFIEPLFVYRTREKNEEIDESQIVARYHTVFTFLPFYQSQSFENQEQEFSNRIQLFFPESGFAEIHKPGFWIELWQAMSRTGNEMEKLRHRIKKIDDLWDEKQQNCFAKMSENPDNSKCHAREVTKRVTDEHLRWISAKEERQKKNLLASSI
jgi:hypothetical protein